MNRASLLDIYDRLHGRYGRAGWWPGRTSFEVCLGAILTQNTAWTNVEKALSLLRRAGRLSYRGLRGVPAHRIAPLIRPSGTYNVKAQRVAAFVAFLGARYSGRLGAMSREEPWKLRRKLLAVPGIGPETADSIVLYAAGLPLFVVDAYTRRVFERLGYLKGHESYDQVQHWFMSRLPADPGLYNDYHAQIVRLAKEACRVQPRCGECPLDALCPKNGVASPQRTQRKRRTPRGTDGEKGRAIVESSEPVRAPRRRVT